MQQGRTAEAADQYIAVLKIDPDWLIGLNDLAWIRATSPIDTLRNGSEAVALARRACALDSNPVLLDTLAAAYAQSGDFHQAVQTLDRAIESARAAGAERAVAEMALRRAMYENRQAYRNVANVKP